MNLSFAGCGFLGIYHVGVAVCFKKYAPHLLLDKISGASAGAIAACCLLCDLPLGEITSNVLRVAREARQRTLGPFSPSFNVQEILLESLQKHLPNDAHIRVSGKLHVSLTRVYDGRNVIVSQFSSKEDLLQALLASAFVPIFSGLLPPRFHGVRYMDGGFSDNLPTLDENTITISPFCGESDICPRDVSSQLFHVNLANTSIELSRQNIYRFARILFPPNLEMLSNMCKQGFDDALRFLHRNNLLNCTRCLAVQSTFVVSETLDDNMDYDPECLECKMHRQEALVSNLPETVMTIFQDAIDSANKGLINWLFKHRSVKLLSLLSLPCTLPADVVYATFTNLIGNKIESHTLEYNIIGNILHTSPQMSCARHNMTSSWFILNVPKLRRNLLELRTFLLNELCMLFPKINAYYQVPQTIKCQLDITEYGSNIYDMEVADKTDNLYKNKKNLNLTLQYNELQPWEDNGNTSNCVINMSNLSTVDDTFENILQVTSEQEAVMAYYYMDDNNKVQVTEIFDVTDSDSHAMLSIEEIENNTKLQFDEWDTPTWLSQHTLNDTVTESLYTDADQQSIENLSEISLEDDILNVLNTSSDPESEWEISKNLQTTRASNPPIFQSEMD
ncbi:1-acylglycerol-3-phosphate O-acyltransferase Pnpla3 isoform X1 [Bombus affinis]|uniref:triacylglycerol lipase n=1 Tax=Bombus terrestris TaxID=30195 RepID=A0A9B0BNW6_BOMTE|nr:1-acylglycerol-3-phosphate O-acyltransferase Pnpla3 isoform X1 [Bombus terrestris]XP_050576626.1 1-acylglycerol-3-phosphate O-acyltransferase Pnpla3 isoform X1 [Bombus affinis]